MEKIEKKYDIGGGLTAHLTLTKRLDAPAADALDWPVGLDRPYVEAELTLPVRQLPRGDKVVVWGQPINWLAPVRRSQTFRGDRVVDAVAAAYAAAEEAVEQLRELTRLRAAREASRAATIKETRRGSPFAPTKRVV